MCNVRDGRHRRHVGIIHKGMVQLNDWAMMLRTMSMLSRWFLDLTLRSVGHMCEIVLMNFCSSADWVGARSCREVEFHDGQVLAVHRLECFRYIASIGKLVGLCRNVEVLVDEPDVLLTAMLFNERMVMFSNRQFYFVADEVFEVNGWSCGVTVVEVDVHLGESNDEVHVLIAIHDDVCAMRCFELNVGIDNGFDGNVWLEGCWCHRWCCSSITEKHLMLLNRHITMAPRKKGLCTTKGSRCPGKCCYLLEYGFMPWPAGFPSWKSLELCRSGVAMANSVSSCFRNKTLETVFRPFPIKYLGSLQALLRESSLTSRRLWKFNTLFWR